MKNFLRAISFTLIFVLATGSIKVIADTLSDLQKQQQNLEQQKKEVNNEIKKAQDYLNDTKYQKSVVMNDVVLLDAQLDEAESELDYINNELEKTLLLLEQTENELFEAQTKHGLQYETLRERIQYMHENGSISYIEVLLYSENFNDFINRLEYVDSIIQYDSSLIDRIVETENIISSSIDTIEKKKMEIEVLQSRQVVKKQELEDAIAAKEKAIYELTVNEETFEQQIKDFEYSDAEIQRLIEKVEEDKRLEIERLEREAEERRRREEEERKKKEAAEKAAREAKEKAEREAAEKAAREAAERQRIEAAAAEAAKKEAAAKAAAKTSYSGGALGWPVPGYYNISSEYINRTNPISGKREFHTGIDIPAPKGSNIVAAGDGTVIFSGYNGGYGYAVIIDHGGGITTLYGHNSKLTVSVGDTVKKGETIAKCGSTGYSTGPHSHFEVRKNGSHVSPWSYLK